MAVLQPSRCLVAATYYVSTTNGNDNYTSAQATNIATPWQTIQHAAHSVSPGDTVNIRAGTYYEAVAVSFSGASNAPITFQGYSNEIAVISGATPVTGWVLESPNVYYAPLSLTLGVENQVFQNNQMMPEARWPNAGTNYPWQNSFINPSPDWAYVATAGYSNDLDGWITCPQLPTRTNGYWNGSTLHIMSGYGWIMDTPTVTSYTDSTKTLVTTDANGSEAAYAFQTGNEFYLSGPKGELDSPGEWWYDTVNSRLYFYSTTTPANVSAKMRTFGFNVSGHPFIQFSNLSFFACTIQTDPSATNGVYAGLSMQYVMHSDTPSTANRFTLQSGDVLRNSQIGFASGSMVYLAGNNIRIINNNLHDAGYIPDFNPLLSCNQSNQQNLISHNSIHDSGRALLSYLSRATIVEYNDFSNGMRLSTDGAPIYDVNNASAVLFDHNLVHDCPGPLGHSGFGVLGLYLDSKDSGWVVHHNVIWNIPSYGLCMNTLFEFDCIFNNTFANCGAGLYTTGVQTWDAGAVMYNNLFAGGLTGLAWSTADMRYNLYSNPGFAAGGYTLQSNSGAVNQGIPIPGITSGYIGSAPDLGALELGGDNWTNQAGCSPTPPSPEPVYDYTNLVFANQVVDGGFESGTLSNWTVAPGGNVAINSANAWTTASSRSGYYSLSFGAGTSQVGQTLTNLVPGSRYALYASIYTANTTATITLGVTNYGNSVRTITIPVTNAWALCNLPFVTGSNSTSAFIYMTVVCSGASPVYADDFGVMLKPEPEQAQQDPWAHYKLDETNGLTAFDASGYGHNATLSNGPATSWTNGALNGAIHFNGSDVLLTPAFAIPTNGLTVTCWAKSDTATWNAYGCLVSQRPSFVLHPIMGSTEIRFLVYTNANGYANADWFPPAGFNVAQWHHYAGVFDPLKQLDTLYVDGAPVASVTAAAIYPVTGQVYIGKDDYTLDNYRNFIGSMDDVRIYNYTVSQSEIQALAGSTNRNPMLHLALDDGAGSTNAWDSTGLGGNGALVNMNSVSAWTNGILNGALDFDGVADRVVTTPIATPPALTVSCWAKSVTSTWNASGCLVCERPAFVLNPVMGTRNVQFVLYTSAVNSVTAAWTAPAGFDITQWHLYAGVFDPSIQVASLYVDGSAVATAAAVSVNTNKGPIYIGQDSAGGANANFYGTIDDVQLSAQALPWYQVMDLAFLTSEPPYFAGTPATPATFTASVAGASAIALAWTPGDSTQTGYELDYRLTGTTPWYSLACPAGAATSFISTGLTPGVSYDFRLEATNAAGDSGFSLATASTISNQSISGALNAGGNFAITFLRARGDVTYIVERATNLLGSWSGIATNPGTVGNYVTVLDSPSTNASPCFYRLEIAPP